MNKIWKLKKTAALIIFTFFSFIISGCNSKKDSTEDLKKVSDPPKKVQSQAKEIPTAKPAEKELFDSSKISFKAPFDILSKNYKEWLLSSTPRYFNKENLFELIDGAADSYLNLGFAELVTCDYQTKASNEQTITIEIYDMSTPKGALDRFSKFLDNLQDPSSASGNIDLPFKKSVIMGEGDLIMHKENFLVHITLLDESATATEESINKISNEIMPVIATAIFNAIPDAQK